MVALFFCSRRPHAALSRLLASALLLGGCGAEPEDTSAAALRLRFPDHADAVLSAPEAFAPAKDGFRLGATEPGGAWLRAARPEVVLPRDGSGVIRFRLADGGEIRVRELGALGEGRVAERAVSYGRAGGTSFWTATDGGVEEWLLLEEGVARGGESVAAWEVEGALLRERGEAVELLDDASGAPVLRVTAPRAHAASGRAVAPALRVRGARIELSVDMGDAGGEAVLVDPEWRPAGQMHAEHGSGHTATLLPTSGKVLVTGGFRNLDIAELYDPKDYTWRLMRSMSTGRRSHTATLLQDDQVLVVGGEGKADKAPVNTVELYDLMTDTWAPRASMATARHLHSATRLLNGKVLVAGGLTEVASSASFLYSAELYDPAADTWSPAPPMNFARYGHAATLLADGKVLVAGGAPYEAALGSAEIYDPALDIWTPTGSMTAKDDWFLPSMALLHNGEVLAVGDPGAERYDPTAGAWSPTSPMIIHHGGFSATTLHSGKVLVVGELDGEAGESARRAQLYDPKVDTWTVTAPAGAAYAEHTATRLPNGDVLLISFSEYPERYTILGAECASDADCASAPCVEGVCCESPCSEPCHTCASPSSPGRCVPQPKGSDARGDCAREGCDGSCDGFGACSAVPTGDVCMPARCSDDETHSMAPVRCPADGASCAGLSSEAREVVDCAPYRCDQAGGTCKDRCSSLQDCAAGFTCDLSGHCVLPPPPPPAESPGCGVGAAAVAATGSRGGLGAMVLALLALAQRRASTLRGGPARRREDA
ncbi:Kelch repeat-containing protein [Sorangium sp. So ce1153]|uniref:Kelch repeat-containing protein n=1 Tax=Sorangium sp. So ce1153 TaxID=3133333 RepID=UPI003F5E466B